MPKPYEPTPATIEARKALLRSLASPKKRVFRQKRSGTNPNGRPVQVLVWLHSAEDRDAVKEAAADNHQTLQAFCLEAIMNRPQPQKARRA